MPKEKIFSPREIQKLSERHLSSPFCPRDAALISLAGMAYFNGTELSLLRVSDLVSENGSLLVDGYISATNHTNGKPRYFVIGEKTALKETLSLYIEWRRKNNILTLDRGLFSGLDPNSRFFVKPDMKEFKLTFKAQDGSDTRTQPLQMQRHFRRFFLGEGGSLRSLNESFIQNYWQAQCSQGSAVTIRNLVALTGLTAETLRSKCITPPSLIQDVIMNKYREDKYRQGASEIQNIAAKYVYPNKTILFMKELAEFLKPYGQNQSREQ